MALRIILMGLVASMGLDAPSGPEFASWTQSGRAWVHARMADLTGSDVEADQPDAGPTGCLQADESITVEPAPSIDKAFVAVSEAMVAGFVADAMTMTNEPFDDRGRPREPRRRTGSRRSAIRRGVARLGFDRERHGLGWDRRLEGSGVRRDDFAGRGPHSTRPDLLRCSVVSRSGPGLDKPDAGSR